MSTKPPKGDACNRRIRRTTHELRLSDLATGQAIGRYHARPACQSAAMAYFRPGVVLKITVAHPARCGDSPHFNQCDGALGELLEVKRT